MAADNTATTNNNMVKKALMDIAIPRSHGPAPVERVPGIVVPNINDLVIRSATIVDVHGMSSLINEYASNKIMLARGPQYLYEHIKDYIVVTAPSASNGEDVVVACGATHGLWEDFAEIRSVAVHPSLHRLGLGRRIVDDLVERCRAIKIRRVFSFTLAVKFFISCGFTEVPREEIPRVVWVECSRCPKFYCCDEVGMIKYI